MKAEQTQRSAQYLRPGRAWIWPVLITVAFLAGGGGGFWAALRWAGAAPAGGTQAASADDTERLYTCGMHPNVIQKGPGECPICHMKLTPLKQSDEEGGTAEGGPQERKVLYWRAPMDPSYISEKPGKSPMGMDLVPVYADETQSATGKTIKIDPVTIQNMGIRTTTVQRGPLVKTIRTVGRVDYNEQTVTFIDTKFEGWIEKLHVDETGIQVDKGDPLFKVYSPRLYAAQEEYLAALRGVERLAGSTVAEIHEQAQQLVKAAEVQLKYFDVSDEQIDELRRAKEITKTLTIHSPARGIVTEKMALEGIYVKPGMRLFTIADLSRVWVYVDIYEYQLPWVRVGQEARMTLPYVPDREFVGHVVYVYPYLEKQTRVVKVRLEFENPTLELKPEMYANVMLYADLDRNALLIPREAYIDSGTRKVAFVTRGDGKYQPRDIEVGVEAEDGMVEVRYGLDEGDQVVTSGQFMLDAESKLKEAIAKMLKSQKSPAPVSEPIGHGMPEKASKPMPAGHSH
ncbi:MAG: efflux RND transporter periplasmic adaptor subunit [Phycisphaerae bacterium]|nr:efflux RND transporter periplasmic adaptor subunit [Phycisphaerae bacterium]